MHNITLESSTHRVSGSLWAWSWGLLFVCAMTVLSVATQRFSGYGTQVTQAYQTPPAACSQ